MPLLLSPPHARPFTSISRATLRPTARGHAPDFNFLPDDAAYALLVGDPLLPAQKQKLAASRVVHASIDPSAATASGGRAPAGDEDEDEGAGEGDPDRVIVNARAALPADGLLSDAELEQLFAEAAAGAPPVSVYDAGLARAPGISGDEVTFGSRVSVPAGRRGASEPVYTSYTHVRCRALLHSVECGHPADHNFLC